MHNFGYAVNSADTQKLLQLRKKERKEKEIYIMKAESADKMMIISCSSFQQPKILSKDSQPNQNLKC